MVDINFALSANGRPALSESVYAGSNPAEASINNYEEFMKIEAKEFVGDYMVGKNGETLVILGAVFDVDMLTKLSDPANFTHQELLVFFGNMMSESQKNLAMNILSDAVSRAMTDPVDQNTVETEYANIMSRYKSH